MRFALRFFDTEILAIELGSGDSEADGMQSGSSTHLNFGFQAPDQPGLARAIGDAGLRPADRPRDGDTPN